LKVEECSVEVVAHGNYGRWVRKSIVDGGDEEESFFGETKWCKVGCR